VILNPELREKEAALVVGLGTGQFGQVLAFSVTRPNQGGFGKIIPESHIQCGLSGAFSAGVDLRHRLGGRMSPKIFKNCLKVCIFINLSPQNNVSLFNICFKVLPSLPT
jgi:hypothetical protein